MEVLQTKVEFTAMLFTDIQKPDAILSLRKLLTP